MRPERYAYHYAQHHGRPLAKRRLWLAVLLLLAIGLMVLNRSQHPGMLTLRDGVRDRVAPIMQTVATPVRAVRQLLANKDGFWATVEENKKLRMENERLRQWQAAAIALKVENDALRALAAYALPDPMRTITAPVIGQAPSAYAGRLTIALPKDHGVANFAPVVDAYGLVGRVIEPSARSAQVLLLSDVSSRVPVISGTSRQHAILAGTGEELLRLTFVIGDPAQIALGETITTSAQGALIPAGLMVGHVVRRDASGLLVKPVRPLAQAEYVRVMVGP